MFIQVEKPLVFYEFLEKEGFTLEDNTTFYSNKDTHESEVGDYRCTWANIDKNKRQNLLFTNHIQRNTPIFDEHMNHSVFYENHIC